MKQRTRVFLGIDFGGTGVKVGLVNRNGRIIRRKQIPTSSISKRDTWLSAMEESAGELSGSRYRVQAAGVGVPGFVDFERGYIHDLTNVPGWHHVPLAKLLSERLHVPVAVDNDANAMALGECMFGAGKNHQHAMFITLGTGVGGGILINGRIYRGAYSMGAEIGHVSIRMDGRKTPEAYGGLETYVGNRRIAERTRRLIRAGRKSIITDIVKGRLEDISPKIISQAAARGDALAIEIFEYVADCLAAAFASATYMIQPEVFIVGGGVAKSGKYLFDPLRRRLKERLSPHFAKRIKVMPAKLGEHAGVIGAASLGIRLVS